MRAVPSSTSASRRRTGDADPAALVGRVLAERYEVTGLLGAGGIGRVYRAKHLVLKRDVALKVLLEHYQCVPELQRRFEREAMALAALSHPNIVTITDFVATRDITFLVMELLEGEALIKLLDRGPMDVSDAFCVMDQVLSSLAYAHARDVIHRDLKPDNVVVRRLPGGRLHAEILDFGLAKFMDGSGPSANLTKTGLVVGTPAYMAPEQASGSHADQRADVYAAGLMFFEMLAGSHPFAGSEGADLLRHHLLTPAPRLASRCKGARIAPELEAFFERALAKNVSERYADGAAMLEAFAALPPDAFVPGAPSRVRRGAQASTAHTRAAVPAAVSRATQRRRRLVWAYGAALIAVVLTAAGFALAGTRWEVEDATLAPVASATSTVAGDLEAQVPTDDEGVDESASEEELAAQAEAEAGPLADADDPTLDEPADAPIEEEEEETLEPEPAPPAVRPAARNPWAGREPATLALVKRRIDRGQTITKRHMRQVASYRRRNPADVRAILVLAQAYASRGWLSASLAAYQRAYRRDPSVRGDPRMLRDLVRMAGTETLHVEATDALVEIYGREAAAVLGRTAARERDRATRERLERALARVRG